MAHTVDRRPLSDLRRLTSIVGYNFAKNNIGGEF